MCGITGLVRASGVVEGDQRLVAALNRDQRHRGPDDVGQWSGGTAVLGQTRLAIVDLGSGGHQPFHSADGTISVVFNGEIYNHAELRRRHGLTVPERCDGAILPALWRLLGIRMFAELRGMWAIAVVDAATGSVVLARDPFGIKPLHFRRLAGGALVFASEPRPLAALDGPPRLDRLALHRYLAFGALGRDQSPFADVESVPANSWIRWDRALTRSAGAVHPDPLDALPATPLPELRDRFLDSVSHHLLSDVPVALLLSSGLDSASIAWAASTLGAALTCVTVDTGTGMGEGDAARMIATAFGHRHELVSVAPDAGLVDRFFAAMQRPSIDGLNTFLVSKAIADLGIKVALSGIGGDEVLAGYPHFRMLRHLPLLRAAGPVRLPRGLARACGSRRRKIAEMLTSAGPRDAPGIGALVRRVAFEEQITDLLAGPGWPAEPPAPPGAGSVPALALSRYELEHYLGGTLLPDCDTYSMAWSVEVRVPFVDLPLARATLGTDPRRGLGKRRFADAVGHPVLERIVRAPKRGFSLPMDRWMRSGPLAPAVRLAQAPDAPVTGILRPAGIAAVFAGWRAGRVRWPRAWSLVALDAWLRSLDAAPSAVEGTPVGVASRVGPAELR
ncbi:asparagine synthase (glutamine-hydrolyzing) [Plantactinospora siamensis]|uniref:asparagine synthase (glutamine-hydrolyzing) n=1 Tax=Plantactinospora siamensis TaxID=555372 RepID=A0ABV6P1L0_9ACTN